MQNFPDGQLVEEVKKGNIGAFEVLVRRYQGKLLSFAYRILRDPHTAEDVVQEAFFKIYQTIGRIDSNRLFANYIFEIVKNEAISYLRKKKREVTLEEYHSISQEESVYEKIAVLHTHSQIKKALGKIERKYRLVITMYYFQDLDYDEIARKLKLPLNTVRTHLRRGRKYLRNELFAEESK